jgi:hypothetical protein
MSTPDHTCEIEAFAQAAAEAIQDAQTRGMRDAAQVLAHAGLCGVCAHEEAGGLGLGIGFALPVADRGGQAAAPMAAARDHLGRQGAGRLAAGAPSWSSGERMATWALQGSLQEKVAGHARHAMDCDWVLVADGRGGGALLDVASLELQRDDALDPEHPQWWLGLEGATVLAVLDAARFAALQRDSHILIAGLVNGAAESALLTTAGYMSTRVQFGRPLSAKQAVRHLLARMRLLQEASHAGIQRLLATDEFGGVRDTRPVLANALGNAAFVLEKSIHLHGGMGFTWEVPLHHALRRSAQVRRRLRRRRARQRDRARLHPVGVT